MRGLFLLAVAVLGAGAEDLSSRYPELGAEDLADPAKIRALEDDVNAWFDTELAEERARRLKSVESCGLPFRTVEAVVRHGRRYGKPAGNIVGNVTLPPAYDPSRPVPVLVGFNGLTEAFEREAATAGFATMYPWKVAGWVDPRTTDRVIEQLWEASRTVNVNWDRLYATGVSVGGHATWIAGAMRSDRWAGMLPVSGSPGRIMVAMGETYLKNMANLPVRATVGEDDDDIAEMARQGQGVLKRFGVPAELDVIPERGHESFDDRAEILLAWAAEMRRARYPAKLDFHGGADLGFRYYWIDVTKDRVKGRDLMIDTPTGTVIRQIPTVAAHVTAEVKGQEVVLHTKEVQEVRVSLSPEMVDFDQQVTVKLNGKVEWKGTPEASVRTLLESSLRRMDRARTFAWELEIRAR